MFCLRNGLVFQAEVLFDTEGDEMGAITYKCPNCGGGLLFDPEHQNYRCEYCLSKFTQQEAENYKTGLNQEQNQNQNQSREAAGTGGAVLYTCPSCGAEIVTDETTAASFCYYCHNPIVLSGKFQGSYHPDYVLPFTIDRNRALELFKDWIGRKKFLPKSFFNESQIEKLTGVYFPYWMYGCQIRGSLNGSGIKKRIWRSGDIEYTETQEFAVRRQGTMQIQGVTRNALKKANKQLAEGVLPFEIAGLKPFTMGYLSGFMAENRDINQEELQQEVQSEIRQLAERKLRESVTGYTRTNLGSGETVIQGQMWHYVLLPVWTLTFRGAQSGQIYYFAMNGQTGKICGRLPVSGKRLFLLAAAVFTPVLIMLLTGGYLL